MEKIISDFQFGFITWGEFTRKMIDYILDMNGGEMTAEEIRNTIRTIRALADEMEFELK